MADTWALPSGGGSMYNSDTGGLLGAGVAIGSGIFKHQTARIRASMQRAAIAQQNFMSALSAAQSLGTSTLNEIGERDAGVAVRDELARRFLQAEGAATVSAAAAGVEGQSVDLTMRSVMQSYATERKKHNDNLKRTAVAYNQERRNILVAKAYNQNMTIIPQPSGAAAALGIAATAIKAFDSNQPEGEGVLDRLGSFAASSRLFSMST